MEPSGAEEARARPPKISIKSVKMSGAEHDAPDTSGPGGNPAEHPIGAAGLEPDELQAVQLIRKRLLFEELPHALDKLINLFDQIRKEIEPGSAEVATPTAPAHAPSRGGGVADGEAPKRGLTFGGSSESGILRTHSASSAASHSSALRRIPSPLQFIRSRAARDKEPKSGGGMRELSAHGGSTAVQMGLIAQGPGLRMAHKHTTRPHSSPAVPALGSSGGSSVSSGLRHLSSSAARRGFHIVHGSAASSAAPSISYSPSPNTWMDVALSMDGFYIRYAQIDLKLHKHHKHLITRTGGGSHSFHTTLDQPQNPWVLDQVKSVYQSAETQVEHLTALRAGLLFAKELADPPSAEAAFAAQQSLHATVCALIESRNALSNPSLNHFPNVLRTAADKTQSQFVPAPPRELLVEFAVHLDELIVSAYELHYLSTPKEPSCVADSWVPVYDYTNKVFRFKDVGKNVQVVDQVQVHFRVHSLQWVLEHLFEAYNTAIRLLRKLEALNRHHVACLISSASEAEGPDVSVQGLAEMVSRHALLPQVHYSNWVRD